MPPTRLHLKEGASPTDAVEVLRFAIAGPDGFGVAFDDVNLRIMYLEWIESVEPRLYQLTSAPDVLGMFGTPRHWQIRSSGATSLQRLWPLVEAEVRAQIAVLERLLADLEQRVHRASAAPGRITVLDTNLLLEYTPPAAIAWQEMLADDQVRLVIPLRVVEELDEKKYDRRRSGLADRARRALRALESAIGQGGAPGDLRDGVTIEVPVDPGPRRRPDDADREVLDTCHEMRQLSGERTVLITGDTAMRIRAEAEGVEARTMPAKYEREKA